MSKTETPDIVTMLQTAINDRGKGSVWGYAGLLEDATAEIERLRTELAKHQWRTMDSAPMDGTYIMVWRPNEGDGRHEAHVGIDCYLYSSWYHSRRYQQPTHWQPLPSPPGENDG